MQHRIINTQSNKTYVFWSMLLEWISLGLFRLPILLTEQLMQQAGYVQALAVEFRSMQTGWHSWLLYAYQISHPNSIRKHLTIYYAWALLHYYIRKRRNSPFNSIK